MTYIEDILNKDAIAQAKHIKSREVSPVDLLEVAINRVKEINPKINAVITEMYDQAFESAKNIDYSLPFAGVPFLLKDFLAETLEVLPRRRNPTLLRVSSNHSDT